jgi:hypothetical protein
MRPRRSVDELLQEQAGSDGAGKAAASAPDRLRQAYASYRCLLLLLLLLVRGAWRLRGHFQDEHYRPISLKDKSKRPEVGDKGDKVQFPDAK